jgi:hypothetical protein
VVTEWPSKTRTEGAERPVVRAEDTGLPDALQVHPHVQGGSPAAVVDADEDEAAVLDVRDAREFRAVAGVGSWLVCSWQEKRTPLGLQLVRGLLGELPGACGEPPGEYREQESADGNQGLPAEAPVRPL